MLKVSLMLLMLNIAHWNCSLMEVMVEACLCTFQKLILSETSIFDVLPNFFYHSNQVVRMAALEVGSHSNMTSPFSQLLADSSGLLGCCYPSFFFGLNVGSQE